MDDGDEANALIEAPALGEPVLPISNAFTEKELRERIENDIPPSSAEEYLARVDLESRKIPEIVVAKAQQESAASPTNGERASKRKRVSKNTAWELPQTVEKLVLNEDLREAFLSNFAVVQRKVLAIAEKIQESPQYSLPVVAFPASLERLQFLDFIEKQPPLLHVIVQMDQVSTIRGLRHITKALELDGKLDHTRAVWLFGLLSRLESPFTDDVSTNLKRLHRLLASHSSTDGANSASQDQEQALLLIRCILEDVFNQADT